MNCTELELISKYLDGELSEREAREVQDHIETCLGCADYYKSILSLHNKLTGIPSAIPPEYVAYITKDRLWEKRQPYNFSLWKKLPVYGLLLVLALGLGNMAGKTLIHGISPSIGLGTIDYIESEDHNSLDHVLLELGSEEIKP